ncbi:hypothetical protein [Ruegeria sp. Ofav3-42]|uniref:hypothetical protein n=1 Tax=Ruegeria sp. Ofav3-42 TaxID=2917759 RepID=UPI001EF603BD|nr:hypothetical protein [Ruegeria sp. Ofav3-42]MCG7521729.1 hypothetical protein [Ruegeria sp. Ofav3-42]
MTDEIWISDITVELDVQRPFHALVPDDFPEEPSERFKAFRWQPGSGYHSNLARWQGLGTPLEQQDILPNFFQSVAPEDHDFEPYYGKYSPVIDLAGILAVRSDVADVLKKFDLGQGGLYPVNLFKKDKITPIEQNYSILWIANKPGTLNIEESKGLRRARPDRDDLFRLPEWKDAKPGDVVCNADAASGIDIWRDPSVPRRVFLNERLKHALDEAGFASAFYLHRLAVK